MERLSDQSDAPDAAVDPAEPAAPKARASRAKKADAVPDVEAEAAPAEKPKRTRTAKPKAEAAAEPEAVAAVEEPAETPKRSRAKKATEPAVETEAVVADAVAEEKPKRSRAKKAAEPAPEAVAAAVEETPAADAKPKRSRAAKAEAAPAPVAEPVAEEAIVVEAPPAPAPVVSEAGTGADQPAANRAERRKAAALARDEAAAAAEAPAPAAPAERAPVLDEEGGIATAFEDLGLGTALQRALKEVGYEEPTPIQIQTIPVMLGGKDVIAQAQTGSGKTAAFGLPIIEAIDPRERVVQALILCPTRELAIQVSEALHKYGRHKEVETLPIYGGQPYERQFRGLQRGVQIVVGTPGRVMDHMRRGTLNLERLRFFVLDEADEMLDMGFIDDIEWILEQAPAGRQTALFSATMPPRIADLARQHLRDPQRITVAGKEMTVPQIDQVSYEIPRARKIDALTRILDAETPTSGMIFCRTKNQVDELGEALMARGYAVETLHGDLSQTQRDRVMRRFRTGQADILIATDVAARGLDIPAVSHVVNYDIPDSAEAYVHRIGRTGRAGKAGTAITLITPRETRWLRQIERTTRARIEPRRLPTLTDVAERRREVMKQQILAVLEEGEAWTPYLAAIEDIADERDVSEVAAAILKLYAEETGRTVTPEQQEDDLAVFVGAVGPVGGGPRPPRSEEGMVRLQVNVGRQQGIRPQDIVGAIANEANIPGRAIGAIDILDAFTYVDIPREFVDRVIGAMGGIKMKGQQVRFEVAQGGPPPRPRDGGFRGGPPQGGFRGGPPQGGPRDGGYRGGPPQGGPRDGGYRPGPPPGGPRDQDGDRGGYPPRQDRPPFVGGVRPTRQGPGGPPPSGRYEDRGRPAPGGPRSDRQWDRDDHRGRPAPSGPPRRDDDAPRPDRGAPPRRFERSGPGTFKRRRED